MLCIGYRWDLTPKTSLNFIYGTTRLQTGPNFGRTWWQQFMVVINLVPKRSLRWLHKPLELAEPNYFSRVQTRGTAHEYLDLCTTKVG
jgi:hypothetical protein